jgi:DNA-binding NtrC family response regulator
VVKLTLPRLAERREDIPLLAQHFIERFNRLREKNIIGLSHVALSMFMHHDWPGNVRELENAIEHAFILCPSGLIQPEHLPEHLCAEYRPGLPHPGLTLVEIEARALWEALERHQWRRMAVARELGIDKNTLRRKIIRYGLKQPEKAGKVK